MCPWEIKTDIERENQNSNRHKTQKIMFPFWLSDKELPSNSDMGLIPGSRCPGEGNGNPLQYSCPGNPMGRRAWQATVHGALKESDMTQ